VVAQTALSWYKTLIADNMIISRSFSEKNAYFFEKTLTFWCFVYKTFTFS